MSALPDSENIPMSTSPIEGPSAWYGSDRELENGMRELNAPLGAV